MSLDIGKSPLLHIIFKRFTHKCRRLLIAKLLDECERLVGRSTTSTRQIVHNVAFDVPVKYNGDQIQFKMQADTFITSKRAIQPAPKDGYQTVELPDIFPLKPTISMPQSNIYQLKDHYRTRN